MSMLDTRQTMGTLQTPSQFKTLTLLALVLALLGGFWGFFDDRMVDGAPVWLKPLKFSVSFVALFATLELVTSRFSESVRHGRALNIIALVMTTALIAEMGYMFFQAAQAEPSHFNNSTPFHAFMYVGVMGTGAVALVACVGYVGWLTKRDTAAKFSPALREAIWLGFLLSFVLTMIVAGYMSTSESRHVGIHPEGAPSWFILGWSGVTGDLRPAHFLSLHAMQALPLLALWLDRDGRAGSVLAVRLSATFYAGLTLGVFAIALAGLPVIAMG